MKKHKADPRQLRRILDDSQDNDKIGLHIWINLYNGLVSSNPENSNTRNLDVQRSMIRHGDYTAEETPTKPTS